MNMYDRYSKLLEAVCKGINDEDIRDEFDVGIGYIKSIKSKIRSLKYKPRFIDGKLACHNCGTIDRDFRIHYNYQTHEWITILCRKCSNEEEEKRLNKKQEILETAKMEREMLSAKGFSESAINMSEVWGECPYCGNNVPLDRNYSYSKDDHLYAFSKSDEDLKPGHGEMVKSSACAVCGKKFYFIVVDSEIYRNK